MATVNYIQEKTQSASVMKKSSTIAPEKTKPSNRKPGSGTLAV